jgi:hypothetical protein
MACRASTESALLPTPTGRQMPISLGQADRAAMTAATGLHHQNEHVGIGQGVAGTAQVLMPASMSMIASSASASSGSTSRLLIQAQHGHTDAAQFTRWPALRADGGLGGMGRSGARVRW